MGKLYSNKAGIILAVRNGFKTNLPLHGQNILDASNARILSNVYSEGKALGAGPREADLAASGYLVTKEKNGFAEAKTRAGSGKSDRFAPKAVVTQGSHEIRVKIAYALDRAALMHEGYPGHEEGHWMFGVPFLTDALKAEWAPLRQSTAALCRSLQNVTQLLPTELQREADALERIERAAERRERRLNPDPYKEFGAVGPYFQQAGVPAGNVSAVMDLMDRDEGGNVNINRRENNRRNRGKDFYEPTPYNPQAGHRKQRIYDSERKLIRFEHDHEYVERIARYFSQLNDNINYGQ